VRRWLHRREPAARDPEATQAICEAIRSKRQIHGYRGRSFIVFCPHALATTTRGPYVLAFVVVGEAVDDEDLRSPSRWRWIAVSQLVDMKPRRGFWFSAPRETRPELRMPGMEITLEAA
jgi:hypothetical protein